MRRFYLKKGDRSSNGGVVLESMTFFVHHGTPMTFLGAEVYCSACDSIGVVVAHGPWRHDAIMGKHAALDGDRMCLPLPPQPCHQLLKRRRLWISRQANLPRWVLAPEEIHYPNGAENRTTSRCES
ncbi:PAAR domain-containing protein [Burkholderia aenigmatica]|uniref:PAAR domain-containing protein n=1 Tax=Burkholderia aenigmatica TaxID=2015348 RepID=UPI00269E4603